MVLEHRLNLFVNHFFFLQIWCPMLVIFDLRLLVAKGWTFVYIILETL